MNFAATVGAVTLALGLAALGGPQAPGFTSLDAQAEPLKAAFEADAGKVRVLMYVSPT
ncbi:MAG: hypothetical protein V3T24_07755 [Longimicrobiales bacterium]